VVFLGYQIILKRAVCFFGKLAAQLDVNVLNQSDIL
jgi:hypothetical protein